MFGSFGLRVHGHRLDHRGAPARASDLRKPKKQRKKADKRHVHTPRATGSNVYTISINTISFVQSLEKSWGRRFYECHESGGDKHK